MGAWGGPAFWFCIGANNRYQALGVPPNHVRQRLTELAIERPPPEIWDLLASTSGV
jgi:hypothetical protein